MTVEQWREKNEKELHSIELRRALWDWQNDRIDMLNLLRKKDAEYIALLEELEEKDEVKDG